MLTSLLGAHLCSLLLEGRDCVRWQECHHKLDITSPGVLQGVSLGPIIFTTMINDSYRKSHIPIQHLPGPILRQIC